MEEGNNKALDELYIKDGQMLHPNVAEVGEEASVNFIFFISTLNFSFWTADDEPKWEVVYKVTNNWLGLTIQYKRGWLAG